MAAFTPKNLSTSQLPATETVLHTSASGTKTLIHNITLHNTDGSTAYAASLFLHNGTSSFRIWYSSLAANNTVIVDFGNEGLVLEAGYSIRGLASAAAKINAIVCGIERV